MTLYLLLPLWFNHVLGARRNAPFVPALVNSLPVLAPRVADLLSAVAVTGVAVIVLQASESRRSADIWSRV